jgi:hypothetical protein
MTRLLLVLICVALVVLALAGMRRGWRNRLRRQAELAPLPAVPELGELLAPALAGLYVGTAFSSSWQDRVVHAGLGARADSTATLHPEGVLVDRTGAAPIFVPSDAIESVRLAPGLAGKVMGAGGLLVIRWRLGTAVLDTGIRADDRGLYPAWVRVLNQLIGATVRSEQ